MRASETELERSKQEKQQSITTHLEQIANLKQQLEAALAARSAFTQQAANLKANAEAEYNSLLETLEATESENSELKQRIEDGAASEVEQKISAGFILDASALSWPEYQMAKENEKQARSRNKLLDAEIEKLNLRVKSLLAQVEKHKRAAQQANNEVLSVVLTCCRLVSLYVLLLYCFALDCAVLCCVEQLWSVKVC